MSIIRCPKCNTIMTPIKGMSFLVVFSSTIGHKCPKCSYGCYPSV